MSLPASPKRPSTVWAAIYRRKGGGGEHSGIFGELKQPDRDLISENMIPLDGESPVLASIAKPTTWSLLTTERLIWRRSERTCSIKLNDLSEVRIDLSRLLVRGIQKNENERIEIHSISGAGDFIEVERGRPLNGFLSVLMHIARRNARTVPN
jgi:hypothetical protein